MGVAVDKRRCVPLLGDHAAGDPIARVARRISLVVVGFRVDHHRRAAIGEQRVGAIAQRHSRVCDGNFRRSFRSNAKVRHIARV